MDHHVIKVSLVNWVKCKIYECTFTNLAIAFIVTRYCQILKVPYQSMAIKKKKIEYLQTKCITMYKLNLTLYLVSEDYLHQSNNESLEQNALFGVKSRKLSVSLPCLQPNIGDLRLLITGEKKFIYKKSTLFKLINQMENIHENRIESLS